MKIIADPIEIQMIDIEPSEIWNYGDAKKGDHIRVNRGMYYHHGVYIAEDEVIHFAGGDDDNVLNFSANEVLRTNLQLFLRNGRLQVKEYTETELADLYPTEHTVMYARACLGDKGYHLVFNNCEHFANTCTLGRFRSRQVEKVFSLIVQNKKTTEGLDGMGLFGKIGSFIGGLFGGGSSGGSRSTSNTVYEPDKVKIAEIEADTKLRLADKEAERIELMKNARLEILEFETRSNLALEEARTRGMQSVAQTIVALQEKLTEIAEKRLQIIEKGSLQVNREIENFYQELGDKIEDDNHRYSTDKLPKLVAILEGYKEGSTAHELYKKRIDDDMALQNKHYLIQLESLVQRQNQITTGFLQSKERIIEQTGQITSGIMKTLEKRIESQNLGQLQGQTAFLPENKVGLLGTGE